MENKQLLLPYAIYTEKELTQLFGISPSEYKKNFEAGKLQGKRLGRYYRFGGVHLKDYLENHKGIQVTFKETPKLTLASTEDEKLKRSRKFK